MAVRRVIFRNMDTGEELQMPVMPGSYAVERGRRVENVDMAQYGELNLPGLLSLFNEQQEFLLPAQAYPFCQGWQEPYALVETLTRWAEDANVVRYIVYGTNVNEPCLIETVKYAEQDGTGDVYCTLTIKRYRYVAVEQTVAADTGNEARADASGAETALQDTAYTVVSGDNLWAICQKYYGDGSLCYKLAAYNNIKNANLIYPDQVLQIPAASVLGGVAAASGASGTAAKTSGTAAKRGGVCEVTVSATGASDYRGKITVVYTKPDGSSGVLVTDGTEKIKVLQGTTPSVTWAEGKNGHTANYASVGGQQIPANTKKLSVGTTGQQTANVSVNFVR